MSDCPAEGDAAVGSLLELSGKRLEGVAKVKFADADAGRVKAVPESTSEEYVEVVVPEGAATGVVKVIDELRRKAVSREELEISGSNGGSEETPEEPVDDPGGSAPTGDAGDLVVDPDKGFFGGRRKIKVELAPRQGESATSLEVVNAAGEVVATIPVESSDGGSAIAKWNGKTDAGDVAENGEYEIRVAGGGSGVAIEQYNHIFPVRGKHTFGDGLGAGRDHQGQDILAECGKTIRAARAGKVVTVGSDDGGGGNYIVIDGKQTDVNYVYMHLQEAATLTEGERVRTGEKIGHVGDTGNATTCHLHFEMWHGAQGGEVKDPAPPLEEWDGWS
jgi:murein DD-endopeptidase MepM/ murein hydrolase activator NlpD